MQQSCHGHVADMLPKSPMEETAKFREAPGRGGASNRDPVRAVARAGGDEQAVREPVEEDRRRSRPGVWPGVAVRHGTGYRHRIPPHRPCRRAPFAHPLPGADRLEPAHRPRPVPRRHVRALDRCGVRPALTVRPALGVRRPGDRVADGAGICRMFVGDHLSWLPAPSAAYSWHSSPGIAKNAGRMATVARTTASSRS